MKVRHVMRRWPIVCGLHASCEEAARTMWDHACGFLPVVDEATGHVEGVLTDRDACMAAQRLRRPLGGVPVREAMTASVTACAPDDDLSVAHERMRARRVRRLPVVTADRTLAGVVSLEDLVRRASDAREEEAAARTLAILCAPRPEVFA